jgi:predicted transcriptional regulator
MSKRRSKLEIILTILSAVKQGVDKPTRIMYAANMSWKPVQRMLTHLVEQGLLLEVLNTDSRQSKRRYQITEKGEKILDYFEKAKDIMPLEDVYAGD